MTHAVPEARRRGRPPRINRERIVEAAFELGIENFTMAAVAERLGVSHQSLYGWVRDRDELIDLMSDQLVAGIEVPLHDDPTSWRESLRSLASGIREISLRYPGYSGAALTRYRVGPCHLRLNDRCVGALTGAGFEPSVAQRMIETFTTAILGCLAREHALRAVRGEPDGVVEALDAARASNILGRTAATAAMVELSALEADRYDFLVAALLAGFTDPSPGKAVDDIDQTVDVRDSAFLRAAPFGGVRSDSHGF